MRPLLTIHDDILTLDKAVVFPATKDRPTLFGALAWADVLLTLDRKHFGDFIGAEFLGLPVFTPGKFLQREQASSRLRGI